MSLSLWVLPLGVDPSVTVAEAVRRCAHRARVTAWAGEWSSGGILTCDPVAPPGPGFPWLPEVARDPRFPDAVGGGWFGYRCLPSDPGAGSTFAAASWAWYRDLLRHDGSGWWYEALSGPGFPTAAARARAAALAGDLARPAQPASVRLDVTEAPGVVDHVVAVERGTGVARRGGIRRVQLSCRVGGMLRGGPHAAWAQLVDARGPARAALVAGPGGAALGLGDEAVLACRGRLVHCEVPDVADVVAAVRDDLAGVCVPGSVRTSPAAGSRPSVVVMAGERAPGRTDADLLAAILPPATAGLPRAPAAVVAGEVQPGRGLVGGVLGYASPLAGLELATATPALEVLPDGGARLAVCAGVDVDTTPVEHWAHSLAAIAPMLAALDAAPLDPEPGPPDLARPHQGVFETVLALDGRPRAFADHLRRLRASFVQAYGTSLTADVEAAVDAALGNRPGAWRLRVDAVAAVPDRVTVTVRACSPPVPLDGQPGLVLRPHVLGPAGSERHKFADRRWIDAAEAGLADDEAVLLVDRDGVLLEATRSSVVVVRTGCAVTPPLDGRRLPGTGRRAVLDVLDDAVVADLRWSELAAADGIFLVNAVRGVQWVRAVRGVDRMWSGPDPVTRRVAAVLNPGPADVADTPV